MSGDTSLWDRGWYFEHVTVDPKNADFVVISNVAVSRTRDGGKTWDVIRGSPGGDDYHQPLISPNDSNTMIVCSDQGTVITQNLQAADPSDIQWSSWLNQPTAQIYHLSVDYRFPYWITGAQQDSGSVAVCSRGKFGEISMRDWEPIGAGGESGYTAGDPLHPGIVYGGAGGRFDLALNRSVGARGVPPRPTARPSAPIGRRRWSSRRPTRAVSTTPASSSTSRPTWRRRGLASRTISPDRTPACHRRSMPPPLRTSTATIIATASAA